MSYCAVAFDQVDVAGGGDRRRRLVDAVHARRLALPLAVLRDDEGQLAAVRGRDRRQRIGLDVARAIAAVGMRDRHHHAEPALRGDGRQRLFRALAGLAGAGAVIGRDQDVGVLRHLRRRRLVGRAWRALAMAGEHERLDQDRPRAQPGSSAPAPPVVMVGRGSSGERGAPAPVAEQGSARPDSRCRRRRCGRRHLWTGARVSAACRSLGGSC
jgi:hypothetical protein